MTSMMMTIALTLNGDLKVTPEMGDNYLNAEISVPQDSGKGPCHFPEKG